MNSKSFLDKNGVSHLYSKINNKLKLAMEVVDTAISEIELTPGPKGDTGEQGPTGPKGADGKTPVKGTDYWTAADKQEIIDELKTVEDIPSYWQEHINEKINTINDLQATGGKDCFSFVIMTDIHYPSNLGKISPLIAKHIIDECNIRYALCLGDTQTRACHNTKELLLAENEQIKEMFKPLRGHLLPTEGNHDGAYGRLDRDGNGISNNNADGSIKPPAERETYVNNLTPAELHNAIYRQVGITGDAHFDESGTGYYIDDTANKVRYIILNTQNNEYKLQADGTALYPKMWLFRFGQSQFDFTIEALNSIPSDSWNVVIAGHCSLTQEIGDRELMIGILNAYKNKTTYSGEYEGTAAAGAAYTNKAEPLPNNTTDTTKWVNGYRFSSSNISAETGTTVCNYIACKVGDVVKVKGANFRANKDRYALYQADKTTGNGISYVSNPNASYATANQVGDVYEFTIVKADTAFIRFAFETPADASQIIITVNEEIVEAAHGYDYVNVSADFSNAKGKLVGYFAGHTHADASTTTGNIPCITTRSDAKEENNQDLKDERIVGTITEQSFDVFTVNKAEGKIYATKIGAGSNRVIGY